MLPAEFPKKKTGERNETGLHQTRPSSCTRSITAFTVLSGRKSPGLQHVWKVISAISAAILSLQLILWFHKFSLCRHAGSEQSWETSVIIKSFVKIFLSHKDQRWKTSAQAEMSLHCTVPGSTSRLDQVPKTVPAVLLILILLLINRKLSEPE